MADNKLIINGINARNGRYLLENVTSEMVSKVAQGKPLDNRQLEELRLYQHYQEGEYGTRGDVDNKQLSSAGWGIIFAFEDNHLVPAIMEALKPLLDLRKSQAGPYYREYLNSDSYRPEESKYDFLLRHNIGFGPADPPKMPYYLLLVGSPTKIPFHFQYQLDIQYAVGRVNFEKEDGSPDLEAYATYAQNVVKAEKREQCSSAKATFFGVKNNDDRATYLSTNHLVEPLADCLREMPIWNVETFIGPEATKSQLTSIFERKVPDFLFTASHGIGFPLGDSGQIQEQGSLLCQDWPGPQQWRKEIRNDFYFGANDISSDVDLQGMIAFIFACYSAGTPKYDDFVQSGNGSNVQPAQVANTSFTASLPQKMLRQGALAVAGHIERAWSYSFLLPGSGMEPPETARQLGVFKDMLSSLTNGYPVGSAKEPFNERYAEVASDINSELERIKFGGTPDDTKLTVLWTTNHDARNYIVLGDPAVRLPISVQ